MAVVKINTVTSTCICTVGGCICKVGGHVEMKDVATVTFHPLLFVGAEDFGGRSILDRGCVY